MDFSLNKLDWSHLIQRVTKYCLTQTGNDLTVKSLNSSKPQSQIQRNWVILEKLKQLSLEKKPLPIEESQDVSPLTHAAKVGRILEGEQLLAIAHFLKVTKSVFKYLKVYGRGIEEFESLRENIFPQDHLYQDIKSQISPDGQVLDEASKTLQSLRHQIRKAREKIESRLEYMMRHKPHQTYLQDNFFTIRSGKYVLPIRLDGHGRIAGQVIDTSASEETLFIHPSEITELNTKLSHLEVDEKIEVMRILRALSQKVAEDQSSMNATAIRLFEIDQLHAMAIFATEYDGKPIELVETPTIELENAKHPLLPHTAENPVIANDISLNQNRGLIISGPNAGGKTVILKTIGLIHQMARCGLLVPAASHSKLHLFQNLFVEMGDNQSLAGSLSTFSAHLTHLSEILKNSDQDSLVLIDELGVGTEPETGSALAQAIVEHLNDEKITFIITTHYESLKTMAIHEEGIRNASMGYNTLLMKPLYKLQLDLPGQSYGLDIAKQCGLLEKIQKRASELRGHQRNELEHATQQLEKVTLEVTQIKNELHLQRQQLLMEKEKWSQDVALHKEMRKKTGEKIHTTHRDLSNQFRHAIKDFQAAPSEEKKSVLKNQLDKVKQHAMTTTGSRQTDYERIPEDEIKLNMQAWHVALEQVVKIISKPQGAKKFVKIQAKKGQMKVPLNDLTWFPRK